MKINEFKSTKTSKKSKKRVRKRFWLWIGKTAGRGVKGQKSRSGVAINGFEGGQMPFIEVYQKEDLKIHFQNKNPNNKLLLH